MTHLARRMFELLEPICVVSYVARECTEELAALGHPTFWDGYFASRAGALGQVPAEVVHAVLYAFPDGLVAHYVPGVWQTIPREASLAARERGSTASLRRILGDELAGSPGLSRAADLVRKAAVSAPTDGRVMYAAMRTLPIPEDPVARLWHCASTLREHRGDGHFTALRIAHVNGIEAHVLDALARGIHPPETYQNISELPAELLAAVLDGLCERGLIDTGHHFTDAGRELKQRIEARTDDLAAPPYQALTPAEQDELIAALEPVSATLTAAGSQ